MCHTYKSLKKLVGNHKSLKESTTTWMILHHYLKATTNAFFPFYKKAQGLNSLNSPKKSELQEIMETIQPINHKNKQKTMRNKRKL